MYGLAVIKKYLRPFYAPVANWYFDTFKAPRRYHHLFKTIRILKVKSILEVGTWNGNRAVAMLHEAARNHPMSTIAYYGFDLFEDLNDALYSAEISKRPPPYAEVLERLKTTGAQIYLYQGNTLQTMPEVVPTLPKMDVIYIDGGHSYDTVANDWKYAATLMHKNTVILFDDYWRNRMDNGCKPIVDMIDRTKYDVEVLPEIDVCINHDFGRLEISFAKVTLK